MKINASTLYRRNGQLIRVIWFEVALLVILIFSRATLIAHEEIAKICMFITLGLIGGTLLAVMATKVNATEKASMDKWRALKLPPEHYPATDKARETSKEKVRDKFKAATWEMVQVQGVADRAINRKQNRLNEIDREQDPNKLRELEKRLATEEKIATSATRDYATARIYCMELHRYLSEPNYWEGQPFIGRENDPMRDPDEFARYLTNPQNHQVEKIGIAAE